LTSISYVYFPSYTAFCALTAIQAFVVIPAWCIAIAKLLGDLMPALRKLLQRRQVERQRLLANAVPMAFAGALCSGGSAFE
jgi:predicted membrane-bound spermidine synthase